MPGIETENLDSRSCSRCEKANGDVQERYSFGVYAGKMCENCAIKGYRDHCGLDQPQGTQADLDEVIEPDDYY